MGLFDRFKERLQKTRAVLSDGISGLFRGGRPIDQALFDDKIAFTKANCPISKALAAVPEIVVNATLKAS